MEADKPDGTLGAAAIDAVGRIPFTGTDGGNEQNPGKIRCVAGVYTLWWTGSMTILITFSL